MIKYRDGAIDRLNEQKQKMIADDYELIYYLRFGDKKPKKTSTVPSSEDN